MQGKYPSSVECFSVQLNALVLDINFVFYNNDLALKTIPNTICHACKNLRHYSLHCKVLVFQALSLLQTYMHTSCSDSKGRNACSNVLTPNAYKVEPQSRK